MCFISTNFKQIKEAKKGIRTFLLTPPKQVLGLFDSIFGQTVGLWVIWNAGGILKAPFISKPLKFSTCKLWTTGRKHFIVNTMDNKTMPKFDPLNNSYGRQIATGICR